MVLARDAKHKTSEKSQSARSAEEKQERAENEEESLDDVGTDHDIEGLGKLQERQSGHQSGPVPDPPESSTEPPRSETLTKKARRSKKKKDTNKDKDKDKDKDTSRSGSPLRRLRASTREREGDRPKRSSRLGIARLPALGPLPALGSKSRRQRLAESRARMERLQRQKRAEEERQARLQEVERVRREAALVDHLELTGVLELETETEGEGEEEEEEEEFQGQETLACEGEASKDADVTSTKKTTRSKKQPAVPELDWSGAGEDSTPHGLALDSERTRRQRQQEAVARMLAEAKQRAVDLERRLAEQEELERLQAAALSTDELDPELDLPEAELLIEGFNPYGTIEIDATNEEELNAAMQLDPFFFREMSHSTDLLSPQEGHELEQEQRVSAAAANARLRSTAPADLGRRPMRKGVSFMDFLKLYRKAYSDSTEDMIADIQFACAEPHQSLLIPASAPVALSQADPAAEQHSTPSTAQKNSVDHRTMQGSSHSSAPSVSALDTSLATVPSTPGIPAPIPFSSSPIPTVGPPAAAEMSPAASVFPQTEPSQPPAQNREIPVARAPSASVSPFPWQQPGNANWNRSNQKPSPASLRDTVPSTPPEKHQELELRDSTPTDVLNPKSMEKERELQRKKREPKESKQRENNPEKTKRKQKNVHPPTAHERKTTLLSLDQLIAQLAGPTEGPSFYGRHHQSFSRPVPGPVARQSTFWQPVFHDTSAQLFKERLLQARSKFTDPDFRTVPSSLFYQPQYCHFELQDIRWKRPQQFGSNPRLFVDGADEGDVIQGQLGDCWFIGALAVLATRIDLLKEVIVSAAPTIGVYQFRFYKAGMWCVVSVDDQIPCSVNGGPIYGRCRDPNELWVSLIEKAYAKLHGCYEALDEGNIADAFVDLTGGASETIQLSPDPAQRCPATTWKIITRSLEEGWLMGTSADIVSAMGGGIEQELDGMGLFAGHAYAIIDARELPVSGTRLIRLRNPWGRKEWKGRWSDGSSEWTPSIRKLLDHKDAEDGSFWMELSDYMHYFRKLNVCRLYHDTIGQLWYRFLMQNQWRGVSAGGCTNHPTWINNPQYGITINQPCTLFVSLLQEDIRLARKGQNKCIGLFLFKVPDNTQRIKQYDHTTTLIARPDAFVNTREVTKEINISEPGHYVLIPCTFQPGHEASFTVTIYSDKKVLPHLILGRGRVEHLVHQGVEMMNHSTRALLDLRISVPESAPDAVQRMPSLARAPTTFALTNNDDRHVVYDTPVPRTAYQVPAPLEVHATILPDPRQFKGMSMFSSFAVRK